VSHFLALIVIAALAVGLAAGPADAKMSAKQKAHVRAKLKKQVKKNPAVIKRKSFLRKAALVNFRLPITVRLRTGDKPATPTNEAATANPNAASIDLGASLGSRQINLGGSLAGELVFHDSFDGGALGNVDLDLRPGTKSLTSTSIPLLWNSQVTDSSTRWDANAAEIGNPGCGNFVNPGPLPFASGTPLGSLGGGSVPGFPYFTSVASAQNFAAFPLSGGDVAGFLPQNPGIDDINNLTAGKNPGSDNALGGTDQPFPAASDSQDPYGATGPNVRDTVLRTGALKLEIAPAGTEVAPLVPNNNEESISNLNSHVQNSQALTIGKSGGQANLFGNIPGKSYGIDVTVNHATKINSIFRIVDQELTGAPLVTGSPWPAGVFACRQVWSGYVQNYIPGVRLQGNLKISPAVTADGKLRIAKATLSSGSQEKANVSLAACLMPYASYETPQNGTDADIYFGLTGGGIPTTAAGGPFSPVFTGSALASTTTLPVDVTQQRTAPQVACSTTPTGLVRHSGLFTGNPLLNQVLPPTTPSPGEGYTTTQTGDRAVVSGLLSVQNVSADVLIGDDTP
jgi:hypothetical protein